MRNNPFNRLLRAEAQELGDGGGAAPSAAVIPAAETPTPAPLAAVPDAPAAAAAPAREPSRLEKISAAIRGKAEILAESNGFRAQVEQLTGQLGQRDATIATLQARVTALETENANLQADFNSIDAALKTTEAKVVSIDASAAKQVAAMGFESADLPATEKQGETIEAMEARLGAEKDPVKIVELARQIDTLKAQKNS
jgi:septal ring factor EnvC (AmiA/AmiB activator)